MDNNLRGGHLAQGLGQELLRQLCAVAPVPQTEDFGIDAMCTILRGEGRRLTPARTFGVQIKAASERSVPYIGARAHWLHDLEIPFFFMSVDMKRATAALYTYEGVLMSRLDNVTFFLDEPAISRSDRRIELASSMSAQHHFWFGPPIATFCFDDLQERQFCDEVRALLQAWCEEISFVLYARRLGTYQMIHWNTGEVPTRGTAAMSAGPDQLDFVRVFDDTAPALSRMRLLLTELGERDAEQCLHRLGVRAVSLGANENVALPLIPPEL